MSAIWTINDVTLAAAGVEISSIRFRAGSASEVIMRRAVDFTAPALLDDGEAVVISRNGTAIFKGTASITPASASGSDEGQEVRIVDAWDDLEFVIYQEPWSAGTGSVDLPIAILGVNSAGQRITTGQQIRDAIAYAAAAGVAIQAGAVPDGMMLWPTEVRNVSIAEVIRLSTRFHPDWVPWLDYATTPPTLNVTPRAELEARAFAVDGSGDVTAVSVAQRRDLVPEAVRIVYLTADIVDGVTYRSGIIDKFPADGPSSGRKVLTLAIDLAGGQMQFQKSRIQTRELPSDQASAKAWLKKKFPHLQDVDPAHFQVTAWSKTLVSMDDPLPPPVNPRAERLAVDSVDDLPRELIAGSIEDWMRKKVGWVNIKASVKPLGGATAAEKEALAKAPIEVTVRATDAVTKIYKGVAHWQPAEAAPDGIAQTLFESLSLQHEGSVTITEFDAGAVRYHGTRLNLTGGAAGWASMDALVTDVTIDIESGTTTIGFGPGPFLNALDLLDLQRQLRGRTPTWMFEDERTSNELGSEGEPGSKGDTVGGFEGPETIWGAAAAASYPATIVPAKFTLSSDGESPAWSVTFTPARLWEQSVHPTGTGHPILAGEEVFLDSDPPPEFQLADGDNDVWLSFGIDADGRVQPDTAALTVGGDPPDVTQFEPRRPSGGSVDGSHRQKVGVIMVEEGATEPIWKPECPSARLDIFCPPIEQTGEGVDIFNTHQDGVDKWKRIGSVAGDGEPVLAGDGGDTVLMTRIKQRDESEGAGFPQIKVVGVGDEPNKRIEIRGNSVFLNLLGGVKSLTVRDGLVTGGEGDGGGDGWWGDVVISYVPVMGSQADLTFRFQAGSLKKMFKTGGPIDGEPGDETAPGTVNFVIIDTDT